MGCALYIGARYLPENTVILNNLCHALDPFPMCGADTVEQMQVERARLFVHFSFQMAYVF
jgi:hypothetical protein